MLRYDYNDFSAALGKRLKELRKARGLTFRDMIRLHGFHQTGVQRIEAGDGISVRLLLRFAEAYQVPLETLLAGLHTPEPSKPKPKASKKQV